MSSSSGVAVVEPNGRMGSFVRKKEVSVALATPTERRRRDGLEKKEERLKESASTQIQVHFM